MMMHTFRLGLLFLVTCLVIVIANAEEANRFSIKNGAIEIDINDEDVFVYVKTKEGNVRHVNVACEQMREQLEEPALYQTEETFTALWRSSLKLTVTSVHGLESGFEFKWEAPEEDSVTMKLVIDQYNWYGGSELYVQPWPVQNNSLDEVAFIPNAITGGIMERYFLSSQSVGYYVYPYDPIFLTMDSKVNGTITLKSQYKEPYRNTEHRNTSLSFVIIIGADMVESQYLAVNLLFGKPPSIPSERMFRYPIWSTWAIYKTLINQTIVLKYAQDIIDHGFPNSQIEIDDNWETCYGSEEFNSNFSDPKGMVSTLKDQGFDVTIWVHPFCNYDCNTYDVGNQLNYLVTNNGYNETGATKWWDGDGGIIDVTNPEAAAWWTQRLDKLRNDIGITSLKFDAGETSWLPNNSYLCNVSEVFQPGVYSTEYAKFASQFGKQVEVRVGFHTQKLPLFVRMLDRDSVWGLNNGLHSVITSSLHMGIVGYPFVLPDMIGGNAYNGTYPDRELFIRWTQLNAFLPVMQFSIPPWVYDDKVTQIAKQMVDLHVNISDIIIEAAKEATVDGTAIIRPMWSIAPEDLTAQIINDQFLVGDEILVAPIIEQGSTKRDIYIPDGQWKDELRGGVHVGPLWLNDYDVQLEEIAYFTNLNN